MYKNINDGRFKYSFFYLKNTMDYQGHISKVNWTDTYGRS